MKPQAVIFDIDGTLLDSVDHHAQAWVDTFAHFGHTVLFEKVRTHIGKGGDQLLPVFLGAAELKKIGHELERYRKDVFSRTYLPQVKPFPKVRDLCLRIRDEGQRIVLASSGKEDEVAIYTRIARIDDLVQESTSSDEVARSKPYPDIFQAAMAKLSPLSPERLIVVGDTPYDAQAAAQAGLRTIGVLCGGFPVQSLREAGCIAIFQGPADLLVHYEHSPLSA